MKRAILTALACLLVTGLAGEERPGAIWQFAPVISLLNGVYDGEAKVKDIRLHGDQGLGTWDHLNGEAVILDGKFYQVRSDGTVHEQGDDRTMPFAQVSFFKAEQEVPLPAGTTYPDMMKLLDQQIPTVNTYYAVRIEGVFSFLQTRTFPEQHKPYPPLWKVQATQPLFDFKEVKGTMVGFRSPLYATAFDPSGYHLHFLNEARDAGGHVLSFTVKQAIVRIQRINHFQLAMPTHRDFGQADLSQIDAAPTPAK